ncbi:MAG TPA: VOC family protein [Caulobacteraceae bacterium]|jgi:catechol 2,3-dioxygenase-like lactoylglutathione lyase family enzyme
MLIDEKLVGILTTAKPKEARAFYEGVLGLTFTMDEEHVMAFDAGPWRVMLQKGPSVTPPFGTAMGWNVKDLRAAMRDLLARGVVFERNGLNQDEMGVWSPMPGEGVAWFLDPDGNRLSLNGPI